MIKFILYTGLVFFALFVAAMATEYASTTPEGRASYAASAAVVRGAQNAADAEEATRERARVAQAELDAAKWRRDAPARAAAEKLKENSIRYCQEYINTGLRSIGGATFTFGGTVYMPKGYGALVVGTARAAGRDIEFKCSFDDRTGSRMLMSGKVKDHDDIWR